MFGTTESVAKLRERYMATLPRLDAERALLVTKAYQETEGEPMVIRRAKALKKILAEMTIFIAENELLVGNFAQSYRGASVFPEYTLDWFHRELDSGAFENRPVSSEKFLIAEEDKQAIKDIDGYWQHRNFSHYLFHAVPEGTKEAATAGVLSFMWPELVPGSVGHFIPDCEKLLAKGFLGIKKDAEEQLQKIGRRKNGRDIERHHFWQSVAIVCDAAAGFGKRYADLARELAAKENDAHRKAELLQIAANCDSVPANPAGTFWQACQSVYFLQLMLQIDANHPGQSLGRFDQFMYPYYRQDINEGRITKIQVQELIECFWIKLSEHNKLKNEISSRNTGGYSMGQNIVVGGQTRDGRDATNDLTFMCLEATAKVSTHEPSLSIRIWDGTPDELWHKALEVTKRVGGLPSFQNDEIIIPQLINSGITLEDARNYAIVGCVEPASPGNSFPCCGGPGPSTFLNLAQCLLLAINNGVNPMSGLQVGPATGDLSTFKSFTEVQEAYVQQVHHFADWYVTLTNTWDIVNQQVMPLPLLSAVMEPCVERGIDITAGGAKYNFTGIGGVGTSNVADALAAIKKFVFDDQKYSGAELLEAIRADWEGKEVLRHELINEAPKYGNDDPYVDELARWAMSVFNNRINESTGPRGGYKAGLWPVAINVLLGTRTWATLDGRKAKEPLADGISPVQGMDKNGPTAVFKSAAALDQFANGNGTLLNMRFHPNAVEGMEGTEKLRQLIQTYYDMKGMHVQLNVVSADTLRDAQKNPDQYKNLIVRVAGYSAFFVELYKELQDDIIARTEHAG